MGIWPPSKPARILCDPARDFWPLMPRPEYRPLPEPGPRPTRLRSTRACAGWRFERFSCLGIFDLHEVTDLPQHACEHRALVVLGGAADLAEPEGAQRAAMALALADLRLDLGELDAGHQDAASSSFFLRVARGFGASSSTMSG